MFDRGESKECEDSLMALPFLKYVYARRLWSYPEYFADFSLKTPKITVPVLVIVEHGTTLLLLAGTHYITNITRLFTVRFPLF